ncbi:M16 family metallopeptidase [Sphingomonas mollis]|uniref:Insulinase family protein n=1 Tax=Sphingomonas mollis TaxID=2795726 RepID=A0ABS0XSH5_9SPHN|nr:pitrilysin family protein [Sphingomonas sp. BT553]MBJ6122991.1 insulinase family protein [Sphingomonas sp. BT553]
MRLRYVLMTCVAIPLMTVSAIAAAPKAKVAKVDAASTMADLRRFIDQVKIPYESFTLPNGLRVLVHQDSSAPMVHVSVTYDVGSKHEAAGRSGFAHLFEHLMFNGSENVPGDYLNKLLSVGGDVNGTTSPDRTNYYENVPTQALERAMFMESDRMGHLLGALDQKTLDEQRGVVQNEKRNGAASPLSIVAHKVRAALYPPGHPYGHSLIGSMKDLNAADLDDVRSFFRAHYAPNNAVLVLAGDIDMPTARRLATKYFGSIPAGPRTVRPDIVPMPLTRTISETVTAPVTSTSIFRVWPVPGIDNREGFVMDAVMEVLGGGANDPLTDHLVREQKLFISVSADNSSFGQAGEFTIKGTVRPGVDPAVAAAALDREIATFLKGKGDPEAIARFVARFTYPYVRSLENVGTRGSVLAETAIAQGDPAVYRQNLNVYAAQTPDSVMATARKWLNQPRYELTVTPGPRVTPEEDDGIDGSAPAAPAVMPAVPVPGLQSVAGRKLVALPAVAPPGDARFPAIERARLANGIPVLYARKTGVPFTDFSMNFKGEVVDAPNDHMMGFMYQLLGMGYSGHDEKWIDSRKELLGLSFGTDIGWDAGSVRMSTPDGSLDEGLTMIHGMVTSPTFSTVTLERLKRETNDMMVRNRLSPSVLTAEILMPLVDAASPYNALAKYDTAAEIDKVDRKGVVASFERWIRPEYASIVLVSDKSLAELMPMLERTVGTWKVPGKAAPIPPLDYRPKPGEPMIVLIDLPGAVQAKINGRQVVPIGFGEPATALDMASYAFGGGFASRLNMNLREDKHWTYGSYGSLNRQRYGSQYHLDVAVQQDKVGATIAEVLKELKSVTNERPITAEELSAVKGAALGQAAASLSSRDGITSSLEEIRKYDRPDSFPAETSARYRAVTLEETNAALRTQLSADRWVWAIVGNAAIIRPQLDALGLPVKVVKAADVLPPL